MNLLHAMAAFARVAELHSYTQAAEQLDLSRTQISKLVAALEDHLGVRLLHRTTRRVSLTEAGAAYLPKAQQILTLVDEAHSQTADLGESLRGKIRVNGPMSFGAHFLAPALAPFLARHPQLDIELELNDRRVDLIEEGYDLAVRISELKDSSLVATRLTHCRMLICATPDYLARHGAPSQPQELKDHQCLNYRYASEGRQWRFSVDGKTLLVPVSGPLECNNGEALVGAVKAGLGLTYCPSFLVGAALASGELVTVLDHYLPEPFGIYAIYPANRHLPNKVRALIRHLKDSFGDPPYWEGN
ncbi:LysR family transcriptional regulator [Gallaecimonas sp. GXIMD4217]|uniref:LysR family transcriptional regulator n=1 Tax=Gallaecimonas sp. GXIMD4217 TaxID=3131927 RepID=UPI00311B3F40